MKTGSTGILRALIIAVISFWIIFFFFPEAAEKYFGVSIHGEPEFEQVSEDIVNSVKDAVVENVGQNISDLIGTPSGK